ncbi:MAG: hypothetical protein JW786_01455 [Desulfobacterales bacterium]|nr:hypothetical protein [Desulfobacterales bacterium]
MNLTLPNYFKLVRFQRLSKKEQVLHILFFVTVVAELRKDMTAKIISHRISDKRNRITPEIVQSILENDQYHFCSSNECDFRDREPYEQAYKLTEVAKKELIRETNIKFAKVRFWTKPVFLIPVLFSLAFTTLSLGLFCYHIATYSDVADISWAAYVRRVSLNEAIPEDRAKYLLYFVTSYIKFRSDMTPKVLSDRLKDLGYGYVKSDDIENHFKKYPEIFNPSDRIGSFKLTAKGVQEVKEKLALIPSKDQGLFSLKWFLEYELTRAKLLIPAFISACLAVWAAGCFYGKLSDWSEKIVTEL